MPRRRQLLTAGLSFTLWGCGDASTGGTGTGGTGAQGTAQAVPEPVPETIALAREGARGDIHPVAWVFSSGGPRGFVHVGVAGELLSLGLRPDLVVGASIGALVACLVAAGDEPRQLRERALQVGLTDLVRPHWRSPWLSLNPLAHWVRQAVGQRPLQSLGLPCAVLAIDEASRAPVVFRRGDCGLAVQAACAIEDRFAPVRIGQRLHADADLVMPLPVRMALALGARHVLAIDASAHEDRAPAGTERWRPGDLRKRALTQADAVHADVVLHPDTGYYAGFSADYRRHAIGVGQSVVRAHAAALRELHHRARSLA